MDELEDEALMAITKFINLMDNNEDRTFYDLSEDAVLDWFGRSILGKKSIVRFIRTHFSSIQHTVEKVKRISPIQHRLLKRFVHDIPTSTDKLVVECDRGDLNVTPENVVLPNMEALLKAPCKKRFQQCSDNFKKWQFVEIRVKLKLKRSSDKVENVTDKKIQRIVLGYSDQIHFIVYETKGISRKKLFMSNTPGK